MDIPRFEGTRGTKKPRPLEPGLAGTGSHLHGPISDPTLARVKARSPRQCTVPIYRVPFNPNTIFCSSNSARSTRFRTPRLTQPSDQPENECVCQLLLVPGRVRWSGLLFDGEPMELT